MSRITKDTATGAIYGYEVLLALGAGSYVQAGFTTIYCFINPADGAYGVSWVSLAQLGGIGIGLSIAGAVFVNQAVAGLQMVLPDLDRAQLIAAVSGTSSEVFDQLSSSAREAALDSIVDALRKVFVLVYVGAAVGLICSAAMKRVNIGRMMSGQS